MDEMTVDRKICLNCAKFDPMRVGLGKCKDMRRIERYMYPNEGCDYFDPHGPSQEDVDGVVELLLESSKKWKPDYIICDYATAKWMGYDVESEDE
jgi:hypothetical protein